MGRRGQRYGDTFSDFRTMGPDAGRSQLWSHLLVSGAVHRRVDSRVSACQGRVWAAADWGRDYWKAGWVHALTSSNLVSSAN